MNKDIHGTCEKLLNFSVTFIYFIYKLFLNPYSVSEGYRGSQHSIVEWHSAHCNLLIISQQIEAERDPTRNMHRWHHLRRFLRRVRVSHYLVADSYMTEAIVSEGEDYLYACSILS